MHQKALMDQYLWRRWSLTVSEHKEGMLSTPSAHICQVLWKKEVPKQKNKDANKFNQKTSKDKEGFIKSYSSTATSRFGSHYFQSKIKCEIKQELDHSQYKTKDDLDVIWIYHGLTSPGFQISNNKLIKKRLREEHIQSPLFPRQFGFLNLDVEF